MSTYVIEFQEVSKSFEGHKVLNNIDLQVKHGEFLTLLGPSGCGKTTLLRLISGFEEPDSGTITLNGINAQGLPSHLRHVNTVFQNYALFPHMSVYENVAFGLRCQKVAKTELDKRVQEALQMVKLQHLSHRLPSQLSGGQQQRVAIARAVVNQPLALLLDEPLSSLDYSLRKEMQIELKQLQRRLGITFIFVTHDQEEALSMSDRIVVLHEGDIQQIGTPREVYENPQNLTVATFIGQVNLFDAQVSHATEKDLEVNIEGLTFNLANKSSFGTGDKVHVLVRPEDLRVWMQHEVEDTSKMLPGVVEEVIYKGTTVDLMVRLASNKLLAATEFFDEDDETLAYKLNQKVWVNWLPGWEVILPYES